MRKVIAGLNNSTSRPAVVPEGFYLVVVRQAAQCETNGKCYLILELEVLEPSSCGGQRIQTRLYCTPRALWKLHWFLQDFAYDRQLLESEQLDDRHLRNLRGVVKVSHHDANGQVLVNLDGFAPAVNWLSQFQLAQSREKEAA